MASVYRAGSLELRRHATGMDPDLIDRLSQGELDVRMREIDRLQKQIPTLPQDLVGWSIERQNRVRDALPFREYEAKLASYHKQLENLAGTGREALSVRQALWASITKLKADNVYPEGIERVVSKTGVGEWNHSPARSDGVLPTSRGERGK